MSPSLARVTTTDGLSLAVHEAGPREAPALVFVHGIAQSKQSWESLLAGPLARDHRLLAFDLRGHGESDKPTEPGVISRSNTARDLAAILEGFDLHKPTIIAWSFGGVVVGEYLRRHGEAGLGGLVFLAASVRTGRDALPLFGPTMLDHARGLMSEDPAAYEATARAFLEGCTAHAPEATAREAALAAMLQAPAHARRSLLAGGEDYAPEITRTQLPIATLHGELDTVVLPAMSGLIEGLRPGVRSIRLSGAGHLAWQDKPAEFEAALRSFVD